MTDSPLPHISFFTVPAEMGYTVYAVYREKKRRLREGAIWNKTNVLSQWSG